MQPFPTERLVATSAALSGPAHDASITVKLAPFDLDGATVETTVRLEGVRLPSVEFDALRGAHLRFPINPEPGYIDGSVYVAGAHHPVDVSELLFEGSSRDEATVTLRGSAIFEYEGLGNYGNADIELRTSLVWA
jgi:hypothetical protein